MALHLYSQDVSSTAECTELFGREKGLLVARPLLAARGNYSGDLVRDHAVSFIARRQRRIRTRTTTARRPARR